MVAHAQKVPNMDRVRAIVDVIGMIERWAEMVEDKGDLAKARELRKLADDMKSKLKGRSVQGVTTAMILEAMRLQEGGAK